MLKVPGQAITNQNNQEEKKEEKEGEKSAPSTPERPVKKAEAKLTPNSHKVRTELPVLSPILDEIKKILEKIKESAKESERSDKLVQFNKDCISLHEKAAECVPQIYAAIQRAPRKDGLHIADTLRAENGGPGLGGTEGHYEKALGVFMTCHATLNTLLSLNKIVQNKSKMQEYGFEENDRNQLLSCLLKLKYFIKHNMKQILIEVFNDTKRYNDFS